MSVIVNAVRTLATIRNVHPSIHREALRLAVGVAPRIGRSGWAEAQAEGLLAQVDENRLERANEALRLVVTILKEVEALEAASHAASFLPLQGEEGVMRAREALHKIYVDLGRLPQVSASDGRLSDAIKTLLHSAGRVLHHRTQEEFSDLVAYATESFSHGGCEEWLCSGCEEAGSILPGHFACGF